MMKSIGLEFKLNPDGIQHQWMLKTQFHVVMYMLIHTMNGAILASHFWKQERKLTMMYLLRAITLPIQVISVNFQTIQIHN